MNTNRKVALHIRVGKSIGDYSRLLGKSQSHVRKIWKGQGWVKPTAEEVEQAHKRAQERAEYFRMNAQ